MSNTIPRGQIGSIPSEQKRTPVDTALFLTLFHIETPIEFFHQLQPVLTFIKFQLKKAEDFEKINIELSVAGLVVAIYTKKDLDDVIFIHLAIAEFKKYGINARHLA